MPKLMRKKLRPHQIATEYEKKPRTVSHAIQSAFSGYFGDPTVEDLLSVFADLIQELHDKNVLSDEFVEKLTTYKHDGEHEFIKDDS